jgi:cellulose synthase/poly-beta-1,6-N-acetylglucosamine synthase-like glycosyltransferase
VSMPEAMGWGALLMMLYTYFGYLLLLAALARARRPQPAPPDAPLPPVTVVLAAWNEQACIAEKLENTLSQRYPPELLSVIVVSDGSTDFTDTIVEGYERRTGRVRLLHTAGRQGKSAALNVGVPAAETSIVVLTDANALFTPDAVELLMRHFADPHIGAVSGQLQYLDAAGEGMTESAYWRYEQRVKRAESALRSLLGANGSIYAIRRELFRPLHSRDVNDFRIPYQALLEGFQVVLEPRAVSHETTAGGLWAEYRRKVRIMARAIPMMLSLVLPTLARGRLRLVWQLVSHKLLREVQGLFFLGMLGGAAWGAALGDRPLTAFLVLQLALYLAGVVGWTVRARPLRPLRLAAHYDMIALASVAALWLWLTGSIKPTWTPARVRPR